MVGGKNRRAREVGQEGTRSSLGSLLCEGPEPPHKGAPEETKATAQQFIDQTQRQEHSEGGPVQSGLARGIWLLRAEAGDPGISALRPPGAQCLAAPGPS